MSSKKIAMIVIMATLGLVVVVFVLRFATIKRRTVAKSIEEIQAEEGVPVDVTLARRGEIARYEEILGTVMGIEQVQITSSLALDITAIVKREGEKVKKGDVIIRLARGQRGKAYHQYAMAEQALENAKNDLERTENLHREGAVSGQALEQARLAYENAKAQFDQAASVVDLTTPIDGVVTMVAATIGSEAAPGVPLATVASIDRMRVRSFVGYSEITKLRLGQKAYVILPTDGVRTGTAASRAAPGGRSSIEGEVARVSRSADPQNNLYLVEVTCDNEDDRLLPGMVVTVSVLVDEETDALSVPSDALILRDGKRYLYTIANNRARLVEVGVGTNSGDRVEITSGVAEGDTIVFRGQYRLTDDARVKIHSTEGMN
jgi:RND family efflux transporter MFP subunit